ncbi:MAG: hypothetical protein UMU76_08710 [Prosthecochloris sp.]|nr:hypothetical protein [Prosthecochloris sp.]
MSLKKIRDMGLAEFVAGLISETFDAITASHEEQVRREAEMRAAEAMSPDEFRERYLDDKEADALVDQAGIDLFGEPVEAAMRYRPAGESANELPAFRRQLDIELRAETDYEKKEGAPDHVLTAAGAAAVREALLRRSIEEQQELMLRVLNNGVSRIVVDSGKIFSRVSFSVTEHESAEETGSSSSAGSSSTKAVGNIVTKRSAVLNRLSRNRPNLVMPGVEFRVKQADDTDPQTSSADLYGEVEIKFRTVS